MCGVLSLNPVENASAESTASAPAAPRTGSKDGEAKAFWHIRPVTCGGQGRDWRERESERGRKTENEARNQESGRLKSD